MNLIEHQFEQQPEQQRARSLRDVVVRLARDNRRVVKKTFYALRSRGSRAGHAFRVQGRIPLFSTHERAAEFLRAHPESTAVVEPLLTSAVGKRHILDPEAIKLE